MMLSTIVGFSFSVLAFSVLVAGDPLTSITFLSYNVNQRGNDYFGTWEVEVIQGGKNSRVNMKVPVKSDLPDTMLFKLVAALDGKKSIEKLWTFCEGLKDRLLGKSFVAAGLPKDTFPKACPIGPGDFSIFQYEPPSMLFPPGFPTGRFTLNITVMEEGKEPYIEITSVGELAHNLPGLGR